MSQTLEIQSSASRGFPNLLQRFLYGLCQMTAPGWDQVSARCLISWYSLSHIFSDNCGRRMCLICKLVEYIKFECWTIIGVKNLPIRGVCVAHALTVGLIWSEHHNVPDCFPRRISLFLQFCPPPTRIRVSLAVAWLIPSTWSNN